MPNRLRLQKEILDQHENCAFVSCWTSMVGPQGEYLYTSKGKGRASSPICIFSKEEEWGVIDGPTHHSSVMFRREAYVKAGGYRAPFYYGQDWDLWYRLAALGRFMIIEQCLFQGRVTVGSISTSQRDWQSEYARLSRKALNFRLSSRADDEVLQEAEKLRERMARSSRNENRGRCMYFIGKCLAANKDPRAIAYFLSAISSNPFLLRAWLGAAISLVRQPKRVIATRT
jgi:hypothetical protein